MHVHEYVCDLLGFEKEREENLYDTERIKNHGVPMGEALQTLFGTDTQSVGSDFPADNIRVHIL